MRGFNNGRTPSTYDYDAVEGVLIEESCKEAKVRSQGALVFLRPTD